MYDPYAALAKHTLQNGLDVYFDHWDRPWIKFSVIIHSGGREDPEKAQGLAHFLEHVVCENIPEMTLNGATNFFEENGGRVMFGRTGYFSTQYSFTIPAEPILFRKALRIFGSMLLHARIESAIEQERKVIVQEFQQKYFFSEKLEWSCVARRALFKGHRLATWSSSLGTLEGIAAIGSERLQQYYDRYYVPENMSLVIVGGLSADDTLKALLGSPFGMNKSGDRNRIPLCDRVFDAPTERLKMVKLSDYTNLQVKQLHYRATWAFPADFSVQARRVFSRMLCSIFYSEMREKRGLTYNLSPDFNDYQDACEYEITGSIDHTVLTCIDDLVLECISQVPRRRELFEKKLNACIQALRVVDLSGQDLVDGATEDLASKQRIVTHQEIHDGFNAVTFEQMIEAVEYLNPLRRHSFITCP